ncbi:conserved protein, unknown function [Plasmodium knowlesi strain H]|uniref:Peptidylprolyl isomerase n=3 Tax=Plasmodium knowlesi TaxID=5850 RepID=A0A5K1U7B7_PLAKH|nr:uncharacterized protein PKNH_0619300 [Plasmodium knowlesi strain H]OTN68306.1 Uncharacterized protein PKNOH_S03334600 [Plasmodium knowlesi]CAA9987243.1 conserved protein, unknown function [Plasmodium knowlesi strain H]SBO26015.1 conserved Plasmodium protein, unknown function [Plasmodium knowlesi strain H]VVS76717.1 conserved protein, unknown function [Plasmodium knowlesi strain H]|eukprot:XP_002261865.1 [Plasmodium knowlesi strain H]
MKQSLFYFFLLFFLSAAKSDDDEYSELDEYEVKNKFTVRVLRGSSFRCGLDLGDEAEIEMRTFSPGVHIMPHILSDYQFGYAQQKIIVGEHNVTPLNAGLRGMCVGELRRVGIPVGGIGKVYYEINLKDYTKATPPRDEL